MVDLPVLHAECDQCFALCCVLMPFSRSDGFGADKASGTPCTHLADDDRCRIHDRLTTSGWPGCARFDCFGAGQQVSRVTYAGSSWRERPRPGDRAEMAAVLSTMRQLHELLALLDEAARRGSAGADDLTARVLVLTAGTPEEVLAAPLDDLHEAAGGLFEEVAAAAAGRWPDAPDLRRADLAGADLGGRDLRGANLRGAFLIGADLRGADLTDACLLGADVRGAEARGARLDGALFLTGPQRAGMRTA